MGVYPCCFLGTHNGKGSIKGESEGKRSIMAESVGGCTLMTETQRNLMFDLATFTSLRFEDHDLHRSESRGFTARLRLFEPPAEPKAVVGQ
jgi:hypothetical protein